MTDPFAAYHRAGRRMTLARVIPASMAALAVAAGLGYLAGATPAAPPTAVQDSSATAPAASADPDLATPPAAILPQPATEAPAPLSPPPVLAVTGTQQWSIDIDTTGYQAEIDDCLWVRMDLGVHAPVVGAHNYCGGDVILGMAIGDSVTLSGVGLDGAYTVVSSRDARAGDNAHVATDGLGGTVILQTCYWGTDGAERLVALAPR
ncbi:MAG: hypothetical protein H7226_08515 [Salinibacterium sp.]|nr:hypothetical protein [Salinibacterium sp.]